MAKEKKELTREEKITAAYKSAIDFNTVNVGGDVPDNRKLYPGDEVEIGNLKDCRVIETTPDFKYVIVEYTQTDHNYGKPISTKGAIGGWSWMDVVKLPVKDTHLLKVRPIAVSMISTDLRGMLHSAIRRGLVDNPDYQRGYVWTDEDKVNYIRSIFEDRDLGKFIFVEDKTYHDYRMEVLDGKQRTNALLEFYSSRLPYEGTYYHELSKMDRNLFDCRMVQYAQIDRNRYSRADLLKLFLEVNVAGVPQTDEHLDYVRELLRQEES